MTQAWDFVDAKILWGKKDPLDEVLATDLIEVEWGGQDTRICGVLRGEGVKTLGGLIEWEERELMRLPNFGWVSLDGVRAALAKYGLQLKGEPMRRW